MITKELIKKEIEHLGEDHLRILYRIIKAFEAESGLPKKPWEDRAGQTDDSQQWTEFVKKTYGCMADHPISRADQGSYEEREQF